MMNERRLVRLADGRVGKIVRVDTLFPDNATTVSIWTDAGDSSPDSNGPSSITGPVSGPGISKVSITDIVGDAETDRKSA
jgi:hypothetical protein